MQRNIVQQSYAAMQRLAIFCLFASFLFCYLEWPNHSAFVCKIAYLILFEQSDKVSSFAHPLVLLPFLGQLLVMINLFLPKPKKWMVITGMAMMGLLVFMLVLAGVFGGSWKMVLATVPFWAAAGWCWQVFNQKKCN
jgi:hypothetical protein